MGWVGGWHFSVCPRPLGFGLELKGFWDKGLGSGLDNSVSSSKELHLTEVDFVL